MAKLIEKVYGEALFELAREEGTTLALLEEVKAVKKVLGDNPDFTKLMQNPAVPKAQKAETLKQVWEGHISRELTGMMLMLLEKDHYKQLPAVLDYFVSRVKEAEGIGIAYVCAALPLSDAQKKKVEERLLATTHYKSFEMHYATDKALIGGMVIRIGDRVLDNSIKTRLDHLGRQLYQIQLQ